ncbi:MAG: hypothetical protein P857_944 [Candidatus Xenolissoclinum pacificiensis L6]|uniref:Uncharacterized protein n=1 Tax=Candidatus Xenolissoclinum pacificiensis L6 TaxID=1401685 RepID=W2V0K6_9RICK|nr:MAG: hypothetical protein P857_944 [Candidatus Xenolissoclinum pacificiensis L6]
MAIKDKVFKDDMDFNELVARVKIKLIIVRMYKSQKRIGKIKLLMIY